MSFSPALILDVVLAVVVILTVVHYMRRGFLAGLLDLVGNLAALILAWLVSGKVSPTVFENFFKSGLIDQLTDTIQQQGGASLMAVLQNLEGIMPAQMMQSLTESLQHIVTSGTPDIARQVVENIVAPLVVPLITVVVFFATFALCKLVLSLLVTILTNVNRIPLVGGVNKSLGVLVGLVAGVINVLLILCLVWAVVVITGGGLPFFNEQALSGSYLYTFFSAYNPFVV